MKKTVIMLAVMAVIGLGFADVSMAGRIGKRQIRQNKRIHQGVKSGELTVHETHLLMHERFQELMAFKKLRQQKQRNLRNRDNSGKKDKIWFK